MLGKLQDWVEWVVATAKGDSWKIVCMKATSHDLTSSKAKHVRLIVNGLGFVGSISIKESPAGGIFYHLRKRMMMNKWVVTVKSLTIFHFIFREGNVNFVEFVANHFRSMFRMESFDDRTHRGRAHTRFIKSYGVYMVQWLTMKATIRFPPGKSSESNLVIAGCYSRASIQELLVKLPVIMDTVDALLAVRMDGTFGTTPIASPAIGMIIFDMSICWVALSAGLLRLLNFQSTSHRSVVRSGMVCGCDGVSRHL